jgi:hypothetical protein
MPMSPFGDYFIPGIPSMGIEWVGKIMTEIGK